MPKHDVNTLCDLLVPIAGDFVPSLPYWRQWDEGPSYCYDCGQKYEDIGGGYSGEEDCPPYCEDCGNLLEFSPTDYCVTEELEHFKDNSVSSREDAYVLLTVIGYWGNPRLTQRCGDWEYRPELKPLIAKIAKLNAKAARTKQKE